MTKTRVAQWLIRLSILALATWLSIGHQLHGVMEYPSFHSFCPFGAYESFYKLFTDGEYIKKIFAGTMVLFLASIFITILFKRGFCGWICPLGTLQDIFTTLGRKLKIQKEIIPQNIDKILRYGKYLVLLVLTYFTWKTGELVFNAYDPWAAYGHLPAGFEELWEEYLWATLILLVSLLGSLIIPQLWCRYLCPYGAFMALFSKIGLVSIQRNESSCIQCQKCSKTCPVQIPVATLAKVNSAECLNCGLCIDSCPQENTLQYHIPFLKKNLRPLFYGIMVLVIFFGSIQIAKFLNQWNMGFSTVQELVSEGDILDPTHIKGSLKLGSVLETFKVPADIFQQEGIDVEKYKNKALKEIAAELEMEVEDMRNIIRKFHNMPIPENTEAH